MRFRACVQFDPHRALVVADSMLSLVQRGYAVHMWRWGDDGLRRMIPVVTGACTHRFDAFAPIKAIQMFRSSLAYASYCTCSANLRILTLRLMSQLSQGDLSNFMTSIANFTRSIIRILGIRHGGETTL
jgi:hypothetical protein